MNATEVKLLRTGHPGNADIYEGMVEQAPVVIKDFRHKSWWVRTVVGPFSVRREGRVYRALQGVPGVARLFETGDGTLVVARVDGDALSSRTPASVPPEVFERLDRAVAEMHRRGIVHLDLAHRGNILLDAAGQPWLIDLAGALDFRWLGPLRAPVVRWLGFYDRASVAKWKEKLCAAPLSAEEERELRRLMRWKGWWVLNRKG